LSSHFEFWYFGFVCDLRFVISCFAVLAGLTMPVGPSAIAADADSLRHKQQAQEKARALASELILGVLDIQLRQLEENGLKSLPTYRDIASMKHHVGTIERQEMDAIIQLLVEAQEAAPDQRLAKFNAARAKIRQVVVDLM